MFIFFDYDGVLRPLQDDPKTAYISSALRKKIIKLSRFSKIKLSIVSGRDLSTLMRLTGLKGKNITLIGSHGLEVFTCGKKKFLFDQDKILMKKIKPEAIKIAKTLADGFVENKPYSFTYHVRDNNGMKLVFKIYHSINKLLKTKKLDKNLKVLPGRLMVEIMPKDVNKGKAIEKLILKNPKKFYLVFGDDVTDVFAFKMVKKYKGVSVSLNPKLNFKSDFYFKDCFCVENFINGLIKLLHN